PPHPSRRQATWPAVGVSVHLLQRIGTESVSRPAVIPDTLLPELPHGPFELPFDQCPRSLAVAAGRESRQCGGERLPGSRGVVPVPALVQYQRLLGSPPMLHQFFPHPLRWQPLRDRGGYHQADCPAIDPALVLPGNQLVLELEFAVGTAMAFQAAARAMILQLFAQ